MISNTYFIYLCGLSIVGGIAAFLSTIVCFDIASKRRNTEPLSQPHRRLVAEQSDLEGYNVWKIPNETDSGLSGFAYGIFSQKSILIEKGALKEFDPKTIMAIIYHELGHHERKDILKSAAWVGILGIGSIFVAGIGFYFIPGGLNTKIFFGVLCFGGCLYLWMNIVATFHLREKEFRADKVAADKMGSTEPVEEFISRLDKKNSQPESLSDWPIYERYVQSYPTNQERLRRLKRYTPDNS